MNERIKELAEQSYKEVIETNDYNGSAYTVHEFDQKKFAELIIRECAEFVRKQNYESIRNEEPYNVTSTDILKHFGVEE